MSERDFNEIRWIKSSYSQPNANCVELAYQPGLIRDSKNPEGPTLKANIKSLLAAIEVNRLSRS